MMNELKTLADAIRYFADEQLCIDIIASLRWPNGPRCPVCSALESRQHWLKTQKRWQCRECGKQYSVKVNTIFEDSPIKLGKWLTAMWLLANCKNGISSYEIAASVGVTQKSAWFMLQRIRLAMQNGSVLKIGNSGGPVEMGETFIGPKTQKMHRDKRLALHNGEKAGKKVVVMGMLDRETRQLRANVIPNVKREVLQTEILRHVTSGSTVYTDGWPGYDQLAHKNFVHETVNHLNEYVRGEVHTQGIENFWSSLKRGLTGTYVAVEPFHISRYVDEQAFRYNNRTTKDNPLTNADRFALVVSQISGKRLTYAELTGKVSPPQF